uniref:Histone-lysine N-methyltransferase n=1 Tax=Rhabditophanes sp. KR3021 TaxID=114890 RepID=A0AC35TZH9_9BILA
MANKKLATQQTREASFRVLRPRNVFKEKQINGQTQKVIGPIKAHRKKLSEVGDRTNVMVEDAENVCPEVSLLGNDPLHEDLLQSNNWQKHSKLVPARGSKSKTIASVSTIELPSKRSKRIAAGNEVGILQEPNQASRKRAVSKQENILAKLQKNIHSKVVPKKEKKRDPPKDSNLGFIEISKHDYRCPKKPFKNWREATDCDCHPEFEDDGVCGSKCANRLMSFECVSCTNGRDQCTNRNFTKKLNAPVEVFMTEGKGWGLRAKSDIRRGQFIMEYVGEILDNGQVRRRKRRYAKDPNHSHHFLMTLNSTSTIDATYKANTSRCMNHSCDPNVTTEKWVVSGLDRIGFFSIKEIKKGEELCFNYNFSNYGKTAQKCLCGSANCKGTIGLQLKEWNSGDSSSDKDSSSSCTDTDVVYSENEDVENEVGKKGNKTGKVRVNVDAIMMGKTGAAKIKTPKKKQFTKRRSVTKDESDADELPPRDETPESVEAVYKPALLIDDRKADIEAMDIRIARFDLKYEEYPKLTTEQVKEFGDCLKNCVTLKQSCTLFKYFKIINISQHMTKQLRDDDGFCILSRHLNMSNFLDQKDDGMMTVDIIEQKKTIIDLFIYMILIDDLNVNDLAGLNNVLKEAYISFNTDFRNVAESEKKDVEAMGAGMKTKIGYLNQKIKQITAKDSIADKSRDKGYA